MGRKSEVRVDDSKRLIDGMNDAVFIHDLEGNMLDVNSEAVERLGYSRDELLSMTVEDIDSPEHRDRVDDRIEQLEDEETLVFESVHVTKDGISIPVEISSSLINYNGETAVLSVARDITKRREAEERFQSLVEDAPEGIIIHDMDGKIIMANPTAMEILGYSKKELQSMKISEIDPNVEKQGHGERFWEDVAKGESKSFETIQKRKDGGKHPIRVSLRRTKIGGKDAIVGFFRDISDKKELERKQELFSSSLNQASIEVYWITPEGRFIYANKVVKRRLGYSEDELKDMFVWDVDPETSEEEREEIWKELKKEGSRTFESKHKAKDGEVFPVEITSHYLEFQGKEYEFAFAKDITERKEAFKELEKAKKSYEELFEKSSEAFFIFDPDTAEVLDVNEKVCKMYGYPCEEVKNLALGDFTLGESPYTEREAKKRVRKAGEEGAQKFEWRDRKKDGTPFWVEVMLKHAEIGGEERILAGVRDITNRKEAEEELKKSKRKLEERVKELNLLYNYSKIDEPQRPIKEVLDKTVDILPLAWKYPEKTCARIIHEGNEYKTDNYERTDWRLRSDIVVDEEGVGFVEVCYLDDVPKEDIGPFLEDEKNLLEELTERLSSSIEHRRTTEELRRSEEEKSLILESSPTLIAYQDLDHEIIWANEKAGESVGEDPFDLVGRKCYEIWHGREEPYESCPVEKAWETGEVQRGEVESPDGRFWLISGNPVKDEGGNITGAIEVTLDITERRKAEERKKFLSTLLKQDLGSQFRTIQGYLYLLGEADLSEEQEKRLKKAIRSGREANEILGLAKKLEEIEETEWVSEKDVARVLEEVLEFISTYVGRRQVRIEKDYPREMGKVEGDFSLNTLFSQILVTRIQKSDCNKIKIKVREGDENLTVSIEDDGEKLPEDVNRMFTGEPYTGETTGVGGVRYYMIREIAEHNNGSIEVKDSELGGTRFDVKLKKATKEDV